MDYFDCDYFVDTYFDTPDCGTPVVATGHHAVGPAMRVYPAPRLPDDEGDELMAVI